MHQRRLWLMWTLGHGFVNFFLEIDGYVNGFNNIYFLGPTVLLPLAWRSAPELWYSRNHAVVTPTRTSWLVWININISIRYKGILYICRCSACPIAHKFRIKEIHKSIICTCFPNMAVNSDRGRWSAHLDWLKKTENQRREPRVFGSYLKHSSGGVSCFEDLELIWCGSIG